MRHPRHPVRPRTSKQGLLEAAQIAKRSILDSYGLSAKASSCA
jgi:hypothetical protein